VPYVAAGFQYGAGDGGAGGGGEYAPVGAGDVDRVGPTGEKRTFHSFRHTFAKRALENGRRITWLSRHLGHSSLKVTTDVYGHWEAGERRKEAELMQGVFGV
jgi:integrase